VVRERQLLFSITKDDFEFQYFRCGGNGGQNQNKRDTGVRIIHKESGAVAESREERSQLQNKRIAFQRLIKTKEFQKWHRIKSAMSIKGIIDIERWVNDQMKPSNLKIESYAPEE